MRDIKQRIKSVTNTKQITKAMNLVSAAKLQKAKQKLQQARPYYKATEQTVGEMVSRKGADHRYIKNRPVKMSTTIVIAGDRGLCGGYNTNICKLARETNREKPNHNYLLIGTKARDFFKKRNKTIINTYKGISENPFFSDAGDIGDLILHLFNKGETDEVYLAYTEFGTVLSHTPKIIKILPLNAGDFEKEKDPALKGVAVNESVMTYEPDEETVLDYIIPKYINTIIYGALCESAACQGGARMTAMDSASENAQEMIDNYKNEFNRARQGAITQEITEIVSGANALK
jgi:F-type H+-transporting ATPase subunit gamma